MLFNTLNEALKLAKNFVMLNIFCSIFFFVYIPSRVLYTVFLICPLFIFFKFIEGVKIFFHIILILKNFVSVWKSFCGKAAEVVIALSKLDHIRRKLRKLTPTEFMHFVTQTMLEV
jgi:hypothetical protein